MITFKQFLAESERKIYAKKLGDVGAFTPAKAEDSYTVGNVTFSAKDGLGSVPHNQEVWYMGFVATMKPSMFLKIALDDEGSQVPTSKELAKLVQDGYAVGIPFLEIEFDPDGNDLPKIKGHEGRGRMRMVQDLNGDEPIPVHFFLRGGLRARNVTREMIDEVKQGVYAEKSSRLVKNPVERIWLDYSEM